MADMTDSISGNRMSGEDILEIQAAERWELLKRMSVILTFFSVSFLILMCIFMLRKDVILSDAVKVRKTNDVTAGAFRVELQKDDAKMSIPIPPDAGSDNIVIENHYRTAQLWVYIDSSDSSFYKDNPVVGPAKVMNVKCVPQETEGSVCLRFQLDGIYEYTSALTENAIEIYCLEPFEVYDRITVIDADESTSRAGEELAARLEKKGIRAYMLFGEEDSGMQYNDKRAFLDETAPDMVISLKKGSEVSGVYNDKVYLRKYGNDKMAVRIAKNLAYRLGMKSVIVKTVSDEMDSEKYFGDALVEQSQFPCTCVTLPEAVDTTDAAEGLCTGIRYAFEEIENRDGQY
jgi:hypothetical protein